MIHVLQTKPTELDVEKLVAVNLARPSSAPVVLQKMPPNTRILGIT